MKAVKVHALPQEEGRLLFNYQRTKKKRVKKKLQKAIKSKVVMTFPIINDEVMWHEGY